MTAKVEELVKFVAVARCPLGQEGGCSWSEDSGEHSTKEDAQRIASDRVLYHLRNPYGRTPLDELHRTPIQDFFVETTKINRTIIDREEAS